MRRTHLLGLAERACLQALQRWGGDKGDITHLFWGTMTGGMDSPTIDILLAKVWNDTDCALSFIVVILTLLVAYM